MRRWLEDPIPMLGGKTRIALGEPDVARGWKDEPLRLLFACCHPALDEGESAALALATVVGLSTTEIAAAFVVTPRTMEQRLTRARQRLRERGDYEGVAGTIMNGRCLRVGKEFLALVDYKGSGLVVKLPRARVEELIASGAGRSFAPAGRVFKEWLSVPKPARRAWRSLLREGIAFVG